MITGVSYAGRPLDNTAMYISKKVEYLVSNLVNVSGCKVFVESTVEVPDDIRQKNEIVFTDTPQLDYARFVQQFDKERTEAERKRKYSKTDGGYTVGENVKIGKEGKVTTLKDFPVTDSYGRMIKKPESYKDVKAQVAADYQTAKEQEWVEKLREKYSYKINEDVLQTVNNH